MSERVSDYGQNPQSAVPKWHWGPRLVCAAIMAFVAYLKLTGNAGDIALFTQLGMEPTGRILIGVIEGICALLLVSPYAAVGGVLTSAVIAHATKIGFIVNDDGGLHIILLLVVIVCSLTVAYVRRRELPLIGDTL